MVYHQIFLGRTGFSLRTKIESHASGHSGAVSHVLQFMSIPALHLTINSLTHNIGNTCDLRNGRLWVNIVK